MALDISSTIQAQPRALLEMARQASSSSTNPTKIAAARELDSLAQELTQAEGMVARRLSFSVNKKLDEVVVKVIDSDTDKVVREIPPVELQHVYERIREVVGILFDRQA